MLQRQSFHAIFLLISVFIVYLLTFQLVCPVLASEVWLQTEKEASSDFVQIVDDTYKVVDYPERAGVLIGRTSSLYKARTDWIAMGLAHHSISEITYNYPMAEFAYYCLNKSYLPQPFSDLDFALVKYTRDDLTVDFTLTKGPWELVAGGKLIMGQDYYYLGFQDGEADNSPEFLYDFSSNQYDLYTGHGKSAGQGGSGYFLLTYRPTTNWAFAFEGDDLAGSIYWNGLTHYYGKIDLDFVKKDDNGFTYIEAPIEGHFNKNQVIRMNLTPIWRSTVQYRTKYWHWENWLQYRKTLEYGVKGTVFYHSWPGISCGIQQNNGQWLGSLGFSWPSFQIEISANAATRNKLTGYYLKIQTHLF